MSRSARSFAGRAVAPVACPGAACGSEMLFGAYANHVAHAPAARLFKRRQLVWEARRVLADRHGPGYPEFRVFDDSTLDRFAACWPTDEPDFEGYFGDSRLEAWGVDLLRALREERAARVDRGGTPSAPPARSSGRAVPQGAGARQRLRPLSDVLYEEIVPRLAIEDAYPDVVFKFRHGRYWRGGCPIHGGKDPNFSVDVRTLSWNCFSHCGWGSYIAYLNGGETPRGSRFVELVRALAERVGVRLEQREQSPVQAVAARRQALLEAFVALSRETLSQAAGSHVVRYLARRGFPDDAGELGRLGFGANPSRAALVHLRAEAGALSEAGLDGDRWQGRLIVPWLDEFGRVATIAARTTGSDNPKYLYLRGAPRPPFFRPARGLRHRAGENLVVVEGLLDAVLLEASGIRNTVASGGTAFSQRHVAWLAENGVRALVLALDADPAGVEATKTLVGLLDAENAFHVQAVPPSAFLGAKDPAELIERDGSGAAERMLNARLPVVVWKAVVLTDGVTPDSPVGERRDALNALAGVAAAASGPDKDADREDIVRIAVQRLGYSRKAVRRALGLGVVSVSGVEAESWPGAQGTLQRRSLADDAVRIVAAVGSPLHIHLLDQILRGSKAGRAVAIVKRHAIAGLPSADLDGVNVALGRRMVRAACASDRRLKIESDSWVSLAEGP